MTANAGAESREASLAAGMNEHVEKPLDADHLYRVLGRWLDDSGTPASTGPSRDAPKTPIIVPTGEARTVDFPAAVKRLAGDEGLYRTVVAAFLDDWDDAFGERYRNADADVAVRLAHTLKGAAATVGAEALRRHAWALEKASRGDGAGARIALGSVERELARVVRDLREFMR